MYNYAYLIGSLIFVGIWLAIFFRRHDLRKEMTFVGLGGGITALVSEPLFLADYWHPQGIFVSKYNVETFLFAFALCGIGSVASQLFWRKTSYLKPVRSSAKIVFIALVLLNIPLFVFLTEFLKLNSIYSSSIVLLALTGVFLIGQKNLTWTALVSGGILCVLSLIFYIFYQLVYGGIISAWWKLSNLSGLLVLGVPIEDPAWFFSIGAFCSIVYKVLKGVELESGEVRLNEIK